MSNYIEQGRAINKEIEASCRTMFLAGIDLLRIEGKPARIGLLRKGQIIKRTINSRTPSFPICVLSKGANLENTKEINVWVAGIGTLEIHRETLKGGDKFAGKFQRPNSPYNHDLNPQYIGEIREFAKCVRTVGREIRYPQKPQ